MDASRFPRYHNSSVFHGSLEIKAEMLPGLLKTSVCNLETLILLGEEHELTFALGPHAAVPPPIRPPERAGVAQSVQPALPRVSL